jgi:hypothetical protein
MNWKIVLKLILNKWNWRVWAGFIWLRIGNIVVLLDTQ